MNTPTQSNTRGPQPGDLYFELDDAGNWSVQLWFVDYVIGPQADAADVGSAVRTTGFFRDAKGEVFEQRFDALHRAGFAKPGTDDVTDANAKRYYNNRSRKTAPNRRNASVTTKQINLINYLGRKHGLSLDQLREFAPDHSLRKLSVGEAGRLIDWLKGNGKQPPTFAPPRSATSRSGVVRTRKRSSSRKELA